jgi:steroid delta-isomerase-like uncharacterized protein
MKSIPIKFYPLLALLLIPGVNQAQTIHPKNQPVKNNKLTMTTSQNNKAIIEKIYNEALNKRNLYLLQDLIADTYHGPRGATGPAAFEIPIDELVKAFPDIQWHLEYVVADGDQVAINWKIQATHLHQFQQYPPSGKTVSSDGMAIYTLKNGKVASVKVLTNQVSFLQQLDALPADLTTLRSRQSRKDELVFIDKFVIPAGAKAEFIERTNYNREFIRHLPGFICDNAYESTAANGDILFTTTAVWENAAALEKAKEAVMAEYQRIGFNPAELLKRLNITMDRAIYKEVAL